MKNAYLESQNKKYDLICLGRLGLDLNCNDVNCKFVDIKSFSPTVGGSPANIAIGASKLGARVGFIGKVSSDQIGDFIVNKLIEYGVDYSHINKDAERKNCLAITEIISPQHNGSILYRENVADINLKYQDICEEYVASAKYLIVSGNALSGEPSRGAAFLAAFYARRNNVKVVMDIDYRENSWRNNEEASLYYTLFSEKCDVIIGNEKEYKVMSKLILSPYNDDTGLAKVLIDQGIEMVVMKYGDKGSCVYETGGKITKCGIYPAELKKTFGSGDAYAAGLFTFLSQGKPLIEALHAGSAAASIVVSRYNCSEASPTKEELNAFMSNNNIVEG